VHRSFRLWHLVALVALVAVILALAAQFPWLLMVLGVLAPPCWAASATERYFRRIDSPSLPPPTRLTMILGRVAWFFILSFTLFFPYYCLVALVCSILSGD
jgi:hypothetical protein